MKASRLAIDHMKIKSAQIKPMERRVAIVRLNMDMVLQALQEGNGFFVEKSPFGKSLKVVGIHQNMNAGPHTFDVLVEGQDLPVIVEGAELQRLDAPIVLTQLTNKED